MRALTAATLLDVWERGVSLDPTRRALALLSASDPDTTLEALAGLSIGERDTRLFALREITFGNQLTGLVVCPECSEQLELAVRSTDLQLGAASPSQEPLVLSKEGMEVRFRLPTSGDLLAMGNGGDVEKAERVLLHQCLIDAKREGESVALETLSEEVLEGVKEEMALADPVAVIQLDHICPSCGYAWDSILDITAFFWSEINAWAQRLLLEVHLLASTYAWSETDILAMSPWRRQYYLELIAG